MGGVVDGDTHARGIGDGWAGQIEDALNKRRLADAGGAYDGNVEALHAGGFEGLEGGGPIATVSEETHFGGAGSAWLAPRRKRSYARQQRTGQQHIAGEQVGRQHTQ